MLSMTVLCFASPNRFVWEEELYTELMLYILFGVIDRPLAVSFVRLRTAPLFFCAPYRVRAHAQVPAVLLAVAAHAHGASLSLCRCRLLVGAPLGKNLQPNTEKSGALWKCPLSTRQDDCQQVETDGHYGEWGASRASRAL